jgi:predicted TIM-barrel fold metal-dependent hydrolase
MKVNAISFTGKIIDAHMHSGRWWRQSTLYDHTNDIDTFTKQPLSNGDTVERVVVSNLDCMTRIEHPGEAAKFLSNELDGNRRLLEIAKGNSKIIPLATCQPGYGNVENIKTVFNENPSQFAGLKFHSEQLAIQADSEVYNPYMEFATRKKLPCLFHSGQTYDSINGAATTVSKPEQIYNLSKRYPKIPVIMAHLGGNDEKNTMKAVDYLIKSAKSKDSMLYADISWVDCDNPEKPILRQVLKRLKNENALDRIMFGTDAPIGRFGFWGENYVKPIDAYTNNINDIKKMIKIQFGKEADDIIEKIFYKNANDIFIERNWLPNAYPMPAKNNKGKFGIIAGLVVLCLGLLGANISKNTQNKPQTDTNTVTTTAQQ